ncbi:HSP20 family protein [Desulfacinum hydrothermale DSM 13146]|uniref:HSP20 family protein n=1 Tax=Desulfacinum hydrothermale DSM 13146 TaxID=1121390 RepID=A0A1W1XCR1_9BACT|nr:Hsp20/alpha crystallin family protein [Desulfacinum hydrothermale]SMC21642.1 HSP20 family protein [Desulfacinum hydrothermale DSM 13146]
MTPAANMVDEILHLKERMDALYRNCMETVRDGREADQAPGGAWKPAVDVYEDDRMWIAVVDLPGVSEGDLRVEATEGRVVIRGERAGKEVKGMKAVCCERPCGLFHRCLSLPRDGMQEEISAQFRDGVLTIRVPKERAQAKKIVVRPGP